MPGTLSAQSLSLGKYRAAVERTLVSLGKRDFAARFLAKDPTLWKDDEKHAAVVRNRLGWVSVAGQLMDRAGELERFAAAVREAGVRHVVLLGMGGSSLCPDVLRRTFRRGRGCPSLLVLDSTDPEAVAEVGSSIDPAATLFIVASKSGTTVESNMFYRYFRSAARGARFAAITDPGTPLERLGREESFLEVFTNPPDIGGRYSALSMFGMVPAACIGIDIATLLRRGDEMARLVRPGVEPAGCPPIALGAALGALALAGRDKVTFVTSPRLSTFGFWVEQLIAESTGKEGKGLLPVEGETLGAPSSYRGDRIFVQIKVRGERESASGRRLASLRRAGHPLIRIELGDLYDIGAEFNRWEIATAVAGSVLGIDPFDEPNVKESKDNTNRVLERFEATGRIEEAAPDLEQDGIRAWTTVPGSRAAGRDGLARLLDGLCRSVRARDYIAVMAYLKMDPATCRRLDALRLRLRDRCRAATTVGFGPRFLHSTGQFHKGGPPRGVFLQITADKSLDLDIPGERFSFGVLQAAQAAGDYRSLTSRGYRTARIHLSGNKLRCLDRLIESV